MIDSPRNAEQIRYWNEVSGPQWLAQQERLDAQLDPVGLAVMDRLSLVSEARVLDVGCGCGSTTITLGRRVGREGSVTGVDVSAPMLARATERAAAAGLDRVDFVNADAQTRRFEEGSFDAIYSRFGVMFFDDPTAAFTNLGRALRPEGSMVFVCWRTPRENLWVSVPMEAARPFFEQPAAAPDPFAPGPFAYADRERLHGILQGAGFARVSIEPYDAPLRLGGGVDLDATVDFATKIGPTAALLRERGGDRLHEVRAALREALSPYVTEAGVSLGAAMWVVRAGR